MATATHELGYTGKGDHGKDRIVVLVSRWNAEITQKLKLAAVAELERHGVKYIKTIDVPGAYELPSAAAFVLQDIIPPSAVICLGCIIKGETQHDELIGQAVAQGLITVSLKYFRPVIFGVVTTNDLAQAEARAGGEKGNKGTDAAAAALEMIDLNRSMLAQAWRVW